MPLINFSGLASGIDSEALIDATIEARRATRVVPKEEEIAELEATNAAFEELRTLTTELRDLLLDFTDLRGGGIQKSVTSSDETAVTAVASNSASNGTYTITAISQLATNHTYTFTENIPDPSAAIMGAGEEGQLDITIGSESFSVSVDEDTTFNDLASSINSQTDSATAQLINTAAPGQTEAYRLVITSNSVGEEDGLLTIDTTTDVNGAPNLNTYLDSAAADLVDEEAQNAIFTIAGIGAITRSSNTINDVIPGVTISLEDDNISSNVTIQ
ncbi:flagellar filament capping protein FliD, partial [bacterium]|nr:flagellar filament capping protein FliD [bacterium]